MIAKKNISNEFLNYVSIDSAISKILANSIENKLKTKEDITITIPQNPDLSTPMWLCTDRMGVLEL